MKDKKAIIEEFEKNFVLEVVDTAGNGDKFVMKYGNAPYLSGVIKRWLDKALTDYAEYVIGTTKSVKELDPLIPESMQDLSLMITYKEGYNKAIKEQRERARK